MEHGWYPRMRLVMAASKFSLSAPYYYNNNIWRVSWPLAIIGIIVQLILLGSNSYASCRTPDIPIYDSPFLALSLVHFILMNLYMLFLAFNTFFSYSALVKCLNDFNKLSQKIPSEPNHQFFLKRLNWVQVFVSMPFIILLFGHKIVHGFQNIQYYVLCAILFIVNIQETFPVYYFVIVEGFAVSLQKRLKDLAQDPQKGIIKVMPLTISGKLMGAQTNLYDELRNIHKLYREVWELKSKLNRIFSLQWLQTIAHSFLQVIFYAFLNAVVNGHWETAKLFIPLNDIVVIKIWTAYMIWKIVWMVAVCNKVSVSFRKTGPILHGIWRDVENKYERNELMGFSQELKHLSPDITAFGFFDINLSLLISMFGACMMYFLILIQADFISGVQDNQAIKYLTFFSI